MTAGLPSPVVLPLLPTDALPSEQGLNLALNELDFKYFDEVSSVVSGNMTLTQCRFRACHRRGGFYLQNSFARVGPQLIALAQFLYDPPSEFQTLIAALDDLPPAQVDDPAFFTETRSSEVSAYIFRLICLGISR